MSVLKVYSYATNIYIFFVTATAWKSFLGISLLHKPIQGKTEKVLYFILSTIFSDITTMYTSYCKLLLKIHKAFTFSCNKYSANIQYISNKMPLWGKRTFLNCSEIWQLKTTIKTFALAMHVSFLLYRHKYDIFPVCFIKIVWHCIIQHITLNPKEIWPVGREEICILSWM